MVHLLLTRREFSFSTSVHDVHFSTQTQCGAGRIHCHVATSYHAHLAPRVNRGQVIVPVCAHKIVAGEEFVGREYAAKVLSRYAHKLRESGTRSYEHGLEAHLIHERIYGHRAPHDDIGLDFDSQLKHILDFVLEHFFLGKTELRYAVFQNAASLVQRFENGDVIAPFGEVSRTGKAGRAGTDYRHLGCTWSHLCLRGRCKLRIGTAIISNEALELSYSHRLGLDSEYATAFALGFLRAYAAANGRQRGILGNHSRSCGYVVNCNSCNEFRDVQTHRTG